MAAVHVGVYWRRLVFSVAGDLFPLPDDCFVSVFNAKGFVLRLDHMSVSHHGKQTELWLVLATSCQRLDVT